MNLDRYKKRLQAEGTNVGSAFANATKRFILDSFKDSPLYREVMLDGVAKDARLSPFKDSSNQAKSSYEMQILFSPDTTANKGSLIKIGDEYWMVQEFNNDALYPKVKAVLCNQTLRWIDSIKGALEYPCIVAGSAYGLDLNPAEGKTFVTMQDGTITILVQYNADTKGIYETQRFMFNDRTYEVQGIDDLSKVSKDVGYLRITAKLTVKAEGDDATTGVADNENTDSSWGSGW